jgi:hypothetical protein
MVNVNVHDVERVSLGDTKKLPSSERFSRTLRIKSSRGEDAVILFSKNPKDLEFVLEG